MAKVKVVVATLLLVALLCSTLTHAARPDQTFTANNQPGVVEEKRAEAVEDSCQGIGEEECLLRRTLAAHVDYIYTQKHNKP